jgi:hypothetical protein
MPIIYKQDNLVHVFKPSPEIMGQHDILTIAERIVPAGLPFAIVADNDLPSDRSNRDAWVVDDADLLDGVGSEINTF